MPLSPNLMSGINFNQLVPLTQMSQIQTAQPQAQAAPAPQMGGSGGGGGGGGLPGLGGGKGGGGGLLGGLGGILGGMGGGKSGGMGGLGGMLSHIVGGGSNPISQMNQALSNQMKTMTSPQMVQSLISNPTVQAMPGIIQNALGQVKGGQVQPGQMPSMMSPQNIQNIGRQAFAGQQIPTQGQQPNQNAFQGSQANTNRQIINSNILTPQNQPISTSTILTPQNQGKLTNLSNVDQSILDRTASSIARIESGDAKNPYTAMTGAGGGRTAYGKYQIMGENIPSWTKEATGKSYTPEQFLANPQVQDQTAKYQIQQYMKQGYGPNDVASMWFTGKPLSKAGMSAHDNSGTTNADYQKAFNKYYTQASGQQAPKTIQEAHETPTPNLPGIQNVPPELAKSPAFQQSVQAYSRMRQSGVTKSPYVVNIDFSQPATAKRLNVVNMETGKVVFSSEVAQGAPGFSNTPNSHQSSLGIFQTEQTYNGHNGYSLRIKGLQPGINDNVEARDVVVHGADYIGNGKTGHSFGCFAVPNAVAPQLINLIKGGTIINAYGGTGNSNMNQPIGLPTPTTNSFNPIQANQMSNNPINQQQSQRSPSQPQSYNQGMLQQLNPQSSGLQTSTRTPQSNFYYMPYFQ